MISEDVIKLQGPEPGPTLAIFAGVHGNELSGVFALQKILPTLSITKGRLYIVFANPPAINLGTRMVHKNLNRCFYQNNKGTSPEDTRARQLMKLLDTCDALLDLHNFYDENGLPFAICEEDALELAKNFDVDIVSTNWTEIEPGGTDGYMHLKGKIGICVECGPLSKSKDYASFAEKTIYQYLKYFDMTDVHVEYSNSPKRVIKATQAVHKSSKDFKLAEGLSNFDHLNEGQVIATELNKKFLAKKGDCIIFPHYNARIHEEAYIIGTENA